MRIFVVVVILALLFVVIRQQADLRFAVENIDPALLGFAALFGAGIIMAEILRPVLRRLSGPVRFMVVALVAGLGWWIYASATIPAPTPTSTIKTIDTTNTTGEIIALSWDGQFRTVARINGFETAALVDIGASLVILTYEEAVRLGYPVEALSFDTPLATAGHRIHVAPITIASLHIGSIARNNIDGAIAQKGDLQDTLIGLSFLRRLGQTSVIGDTLILQE